MVLGTIGYPLYGAGLCVTVSSRSTPSEFASYADTQTATRLSRGLCFLVRSIILFESLL